MARVVVTGAFGYLGLATLRGLWQRPLVAVGHPARVANPPLPKDVEVHHGEISLAAELIRSGEGAVSVVHLAGGGGEARCREDSVGAVQSIVHGTSLVARAARVASASRMIFASTIAVYGTFRDHGRPYAETDQARPDDLYGSLKAAAEHVWTEHGGGIALRIANIYGAGAGVDLGINGAVERFARAAARGEELTMYGDGSQRIDYVHVDDVVSAIRACLNPEAELDIPSVLNIGSGKPVTIRELAEACIRAGEAIGKRPRLTSKPAPEGKTWPDRSLDIGLAQRTISWSPRVPLDDGIRELVEMMAK
jgi:nucleoside-diphosphate-sugar epimerase